jgi:branched-subunit amino acid transport protein
MTAAVLALTAAGLATWLLRVLFVTLVPARRLPAPVRRGLDHAAPAVLAALVATSLVGDAGPLALITPSPMLIALVTGGAVAVMTRQPLAGIAAALGSFALLGAL